MNSLATLLKCSGPLSRQGAFRCFASLGANDENIRKRIIEKDDLMEEVLTGLGDPIGDVRLAAVRCLHSLSRSVQQLRTTFQVSGCECYHFLNASPLMLSIRLVVHLGPFGVATSHGTAHWQTVNRIANCGHVDHLQSLVGILTGQRAHGRIGGY